PKEAINNYTIMLMSPMMVQLMTGMGGLTRPIFNTVISNVPGPSKDLYFAGCKLSEFYPISLIPHGQALNITVVSYSGQFNVSFTGDHDAMPSMQRLSVYSGEALEELEVLLGIKKAPAGKRAPAKRAASVKKTVTARKPAAKKAPAKKVTAKSTSSS
ncbi:MAG: WS/DGAT domain-containing protein, partial [Limnobacter sp.]|nr:WS/DGAT domain-containing protein [Limnobacter sp.]